VSGQKRIERCESRGEQGAREKSRAALSAKENAGALHDNFSGPAFLLNPARPPGKIRHPTWSSWRSGNAMKPPLLHPSRWLVVLWLPLVGLACDTGGDRNNGKSSAERAATATAPTTKGASSGKTSNVPHPPPSFEVEVKNVKACWDEADRQQRFTLILTNTGKHTENVFAIVYGCNEAVAPPRRALSPQTAQDWFKLAGSQDGRLTAKEIEEHWKEDAFISGRGGKLKPYHDARVKARDSVEIKDTAHALDKKETIHPATKDQALASVGFTLYKVWLFTEDGKCFLEKEIAVEPVNVKGKRPVD
jgi:hypothetical protein